MPPDSDTIATWRDHYCDMLLIRRFEEKAGQLYGMGRIGGFCHLCIGLEAVIVGCATATREGDARIASYRCHGHMLAAGMDPGRILAEMTGAATGYSGGKGGSMHMASPGHGFFGGHGIPGGHVPIGAGLAFAQRYDKTGGITLCALGDGAAHQGQVTETYDLAVRLGLPILFVIENNRTAPGVAPVPGGQGLLDRAAAHGIPGRGVDGMDVVAVAEAACAAAAEVRAGLGPRVLEATIIRFQGHAMASADKALSAAQMRKARTMRDPIAALKQRLLGAGLSEDTLKAIDIAVKETVGDAAEMARVAPAPDATGLRAAMTAEG
ncbi:thiamine pyrophosphate-dependent enzyme [Roseivivax sp. CAU 1753]